jgi:hypothetical protein
VLRTTLAQLSGLRAALEPRHGIVAMAIRTPPLDYVPSTVAEAHASYAVMCRADGVMYHDALCTAARQLGMAVHLHARGTEVKRASDRLGGGAADVERLLAVEGARLGPPWQKEHRLAAAAAIGVLGSFSDILSSPR